MWCRFKATRAWDYADRFANLRAEVPCSSKPYRVVVTRSDVNNRYSNITEMMNVFSPENWMTFVTSPTTIIDGERAGSIGIARPPGYVWRGHIEGALGRRLWLHIRSAVGPAHAEAEIDADGSFGFMTDSSESRTCSMSSMISAPLSFRRCSKSKTIRLTNTSLSSFLPEPPKKTWCAS